MIRDPRLENYLTSLERVLRPFPVSDRAEIITEIKSHVLSALERDPQARLDVVLAALGEPETVANRYLLERGMKPAKPPISPIVKWVVIGFLGTIAMLLVFAGFMAMKFMPLVHVDEKNDKVALLGGLVRVEGDDGRFSIEGLFDSSKSGRQFQGAVPAAPSVPVKVKFKNGKIEVSSSDDAEFHWNCKGRGREQEAPVPAVSGTSVDFDLTRYAKVQCALAVPVNGRLLVTGTNGKVEVSEARFNLDVNVMNGYVAFAPEEGRNYKYDVVVKNGVTDTFESSSAKDALEIHIQVMNGKVKKEE